MYKHHTHLLHSFLQLQNKNPLALRLLPSPKEPSGLYLLFVLLWKQRQGLCTSTRVSVSSTRCTALTWAGRGFRDLDAATSQPNPRESTALPHVSSILRPRVRSGSELCE